MQLKQTPFTIRAGITACCICFMLTKSSAQNFQLMRYDEDYSNLKEDSAKRFYDKIKFIPLSKDKKIFLSLGGDIRYEYDAFNNEDWGRFNAGHDNFFLQRYDFYTNVQLGSRLRVFALLRSALENGRPHGPRPIDEDKLNVENLFADFKIWQGSNDMMTIRGGRQEINYGSGRLISVRDGPNLRLYFTGAKLMYYYKHLSIDAFAMEADSVYTGVYDNKGTKELNLWGVYSSIAVPFLQNVDLYYIGIRRDNAPFEEGVENERRQSFGVRIWRNWNGLNYDLEAVYQFGRFGAGAINAWADFLDVSYLFGSKWMPQIGIRNDYISGDKKAGDGSLQSFNPIYPKAGYFSGFDPQLGAVNLIDLHPYASVHLSANFTFNVDIAFNWRYSLGDGVYRPNGFINIPGSSSEARYIGTAYLVKLSYNINAFLNINFGAQAFDTGPFIDDVIKGAKNAFLTNSQVVFRF